MITQTTAFHNAVKSGAEQLILFRFSDAVMSNADMKAGVKFDECFNAEEDYTVGQALSSTIEATLANPNGILSSLSWGEFKASLGVLTSTSTQVLPTGCDCAVGGFRAYNESPYIRTVSGDTETALSVQPSFVPQSIACEDGILYAFGANSTCWAAVPNPTTWGLASNTTWANGGTWAEVAPFSMSITLNNYMKAKVATWSGSAFHLNGSILTCAAGSQVKQYELCPLGYFIAERPKTVRTSTVSMTASDRMGKLDFKMSELSITYPISAINLAKAIASHAGISLNSESFLNNSAIVPNDGGNEAPDGITEMTGREVVQWIAELSCTNAKMTRDGKLEFKDLTTVTFPVTSADYITAEVAEYQTTVIDKLQIRNSDSDVGRIIGIGTEVYAIQENPFLEPSYSATTGQSIYNKLHSIASIKPITADLFYDWSVEAGDIITVGGNSCPVYTVSMSWTGIARATIASTGNKSRGTESRENRQTYSNNKQRYELVTDVDGLKSSVYDSDGNSKIAQNAAAISLRVEKSGVISAINQTAESIKISASKISIDGVLSVNSSFQIDSSGYLRCTGGTIGGFTISSGALYNGDSGYSGTSGVYLGTDGIRLGGNFRVDSSGNLTCSNASISGAVTCTSLTVNGNTWTAANANNSLSGGSSAYSNGSYWSSGGSFAYYCHGTSYSNYAVDASYLRMPYNSSTTVLTVRKITINGTQYLIPAGVYG